MDGAAFGREVVAAVKAYLEPWQRRVAELEAELATVKKRSCWLAGPYSRGVEYEAGAVVQSGGALWLALITSKGLAPSDSNPAAWLLLNKTSNRHGHVRPRRRRTLQTDGATTQHDAR